MALFGNSVEKCLTELRGLHQARGKLTAADLADAAKLAELRAGQGEVELGELLNSKTDPAPGELGSPAAQLRWQIMALGEAIEGRAAARPRLLEKIRDAIRQVAAARAAELRKTADKKAKELASHREKVDGHLEALREMDGCPYGPRPEVPATFHPGLPVFALMASQGAGPVTMRFEAEIEGLRRQADAIEQRAADGTKGGRISGATLTELVGVCDNPERITPTRAEIEAWYSAAEGRAETVWQRRALDYGGRGVPQHEVTFTLQWDSDGRIDQQVSAAEPRAISPFEMQAAASRRPVVAA